MNDLRREKQSRARTMTITGLAAGAVLCLAGITTGFPLLGGLGGLVVTLAGVWRGQLELAALPPMLPEYLSQHLEIRHVADRLEPRLKLLPDVVDQLKDLVEVDAALRSKASFSVHRVRQWYAESKKEGRVGIFDRLQGGLKTLTGQDPLTELQYMVDTLRTILDREISELTGEVLLGDAQRRQERKELLDILTKQREAFELQCTTLRKVNERLKQVRESIRTIDLQAANMASLEVDELRAAGGRLLTSIGQDVTLLEQVLEELRSAPASAHPRITDGKS